MIASITQWRQIGQSRGQPDSTQPFERILALAREIRRGGLSAAMAVPPRGIWLPARQDAGRLHPRIDVARSAVLQSTATMETGSHQLRKAAHIDRLPEMPEIDERILSRLERPYGLIAEWLKYTSWESMAGKKFIAIYASSEESDGRHITWIDGRTPAGDHLVNRFVVPKDLFERTHRHFQETFAARLDEDDNFPWHMWVVGRIPIAYGDFLAAVIRAATAL